MIKGRIKRAADKALETGPQVSSTEVHGANGLRALNVKLA